MATETGDSSTETEEATETGDAVTPYMRGIIITTTATLLGMFAAVLSMLYATSGSEPDNFTGMLILLGAILIQFPFYNLVGIDVEGFSTKDQLYIFFMTFVLWFVTWSILLTTGTFA